MKISTKYGPQCYANEAAATRAFLESTNSITFTDDDMEVPYSDHLRPLYLEAWINGVHIRRALVDTGSSINIIPLAVLTAAKIPLKRIIKSEIQITGFGNKSEMCMGFIQLDLQVGPIKSQTRFNVQDVDVSYHVLLGRPWLNKHKLIGSTYHQYY